MVPLVGFALIIVALIGFALIIAGFVTNDEPMRHVGISAFILGLMMVSALSLWKRRKQRRVETKSKAESERVPLTSALTEAAVRSMKAKQGRR